MLYGAFDGLAQYLTRARTRAILLLYVDRVFRDIPDDARVLEIGGGYNPRFLKSDRENVYHLDHATADELRKKYADDPMAGPYIDRIQPVDFVFDGGPIENLVPDDLRFDVVFSSHSLEHQVDLVGHLQSVEKLLAPNGKAIFVIPDHRCCFDALRFPTVVADVIDVHRNGHGRHRGKQIFEQVTRTIDINPGRRVRWPDVARARFNSSLSDGLEAIENADRPDAEYLDAHAWVFTPLSFRLLMLELYLLGFVRLRPTFISPTYGNQFCTVLQPSRPVAELDKSEARGLNAERLRLTKRLSK